MLNGVYSSPALFTSTNIHSFRKPLLNRKKGSTSSLAIPNYGDVELRTKELIKILGLDIPPNIPVENLSLGIRQWAEILKALFVGASQRLF
jgi:ABC-type uncharacterized transport system ATPase subunit